MNYAEFLERKKRVAAGIGIRGADCALPSKLYDWQAAGRENCEGSEVTRESGGICDGCAQARSECLCDVDLDEVLDCNSPFHPGCRKCEQPPEHDKRRTSRLRIW